MSKLGWILLTALSASPAVQDGVVSEPELKAAYLFNFARHVEWPVDAFPRENAPFVVAILGRADAAEAVERALAGKSVQGRSFEIRRAAGVDGLKGAHLAYVSSGGDIEIKAILKAVEGTRTLTVGESPDFLRAGGVMSFFVEDRKLRFEVNLKGADRAGLVVSSKLLRIARVMKGDE